MRSAIAADGISRRAAIHALGPLLLSPLLKPLSAVAFENRLPPDEVELKYKTPRTAGPAPTGIGPQKQGGLKSCVDGKPHCFSTTAEVFEDSDLSNADYGTAGAEWLVTPFRYDKPLAEAFADVKASVAAYPPGQRGIDGGGFKVMQESVSGDSAYMYVQFESRRRGYIDDFEILLAQGKADVRTSSRLGYLDMGVNAKRFNWFAVGPRHSLIETAMTRRTHC